MLLTIIIYLLTNDLHNKDDKWEVALFIIYIYIYIHILMWIKIEITHNKAQADGQKQMDTIKPVSLHL